MTRTRALPFKEHDDQEMDHVSVVVDDLDRDTGDIIFSGSAHDDG